MQALATETIVQRIIDILKASSSPDLRLVPTGPIAKYVFGRPDETELSDTYPVIWCEAGGLGGNFYDDAGNGNSTQIGHIVTVTIGIIERDAKAETSESNALARHDDVRFALRKDADLTGTGAALVQNVALAWASAKQVSQLDTDFITEVALVCRWLLLEDVN